GDSTRTVCGPFPLSAKLTLYDAIPSASVLTSLGLPEAAGGSAVTWCGSVPREPPPGETRTASSRPKISMKPTSHRTLNLENLTACMTPSQDHELTEVPYPTRLSKAAAAIREARWITKLWWPT